MVDFIGKPGETRKVEKAEPKPVVEKKAAPKVEKAEAEPKVKAEKPAVSPAKEARCEEDGEVQKGASKKIRRKEILDSKKSSK